MSIGVPGAEFLFDGHVEMLDLPFVLPDGSSRTITFPLMRECGTLVTKSGTVMHSKRLRDAFDVYLAIVQARSRDGLLDACRQLNPKWEAQFIALSKLAQTVRNHRNQFCKRVQKVWWMSANAPSFDEAVSLGLDEESIPNDLLSFFDDIPTRRIDAENV